ncbi:alpha/beta fold hydrolase [Solwaraspora sp. WMMB335]|uniref:alpha/beta fold hydrolase n=1 Tax=Solwaraspora sp. WMMB335 TaxID=3404118 RepID=UPI003B927012
MVRLRRRFTGARITALVVIGALTTGLGQVATPASRSVVEVPSGARAGDFTQRPCRYETEDGPREADCGTLVVPENRLRPDSRLIALPVIRIRATGERPGEPVFWLTGGPGGTNLKIRQAGRLTGGHDVVLVGYRGVDSSTILDCPEVPAVLRVSADLTGPDTQSRYATALADCYHRLAGNGVDLDGYSLPQRVDDLEEARRALGYDRINLLSTSAGTRTAMIYAWRHPRVVHRSAMISVNPPGHFLWDPAITDRQLRYYSTLCARDPGCSARTPDLVASMTATAADMPTRWGLLPIKEGTVRAATLWGMFHSTSSSAPLNAPTTIDAWQAAAAGDPSGFWALSVLADLALPDSFVWGEFAASGVIDAEAIRNFYAAGGDRHSILGNAPVEFLWAGGGLTQAWPASPDYDGYRTVRPSDVETLLIGGTVDFSTPAELATAELLPALSNGHQVILAELGHSGDFWNAQPEAATHLLTTFFDQGKVDASHFRAQPVDFAGVAPSMSTIARVLAGLLVGVALLGMMLLALLTYRVRRRGGFGPRSSVVIRTLVPPVAGLGGWFLALLTVASVWPGLLGSQVLAVLAVAPAVGAGVWLGSIQRDRPGGRGGFLAAAMTGALVGAGIGALLVPGYAGSLVALACACLAANLGVLLLELTRSPATVGARRRPLPR